MKRISKLMSAGLLTASILLLFSCKENNTPSANSYQGDVKLLSKVEKIVAEDLSKDESEEMIIEEILDEVIADLEEFDFLKSEGTCPVVTIDNPEGSRYPRVVTKDFGDGCFNERGAERSGKIIVTIFGKWLQEGSVRTVTFENYTSNGVAVSGEKKIVCLGLNDDSLYVHKITGNIEMLKPDSVLVKREIHKRRTILSGVNNSDVPMEWLIEGHVKVEKSTGVNYEMHIKEPLYRIQGCKWFQSGTKTILFEVNNAEKEELTKHRVLIDYSYEESDNECDNYALRYIDDEEPVVINLR